MFKNLTDLSYKRTTKEAVGFYIAYLLIFMIAGAIGGVLFLNVENSESFAAGVNIGSKISIILSIIISFSVIYAKKISNNFGYIILALISPILAAFGGGLLALIPIAYLTTRGTPNNPS